MQQAPWVETAWQNAQELSARQVLPCAPQLLCGTFCVQRPATQQEPCCAGVALQVDAAQLCVVEKLPRQFASMTSLHDPSTVLQQAPCRE
jgi:hypothetical protein